MLENTKVYLRKICLRNCREASIKLPFLRNVFVVRLRYCELLFTMRDSYSRITITKYPFFFISLQKADTNRKCFRTLLNNISRTILTLTNWNAVVSITFNGKYSDKWTIMIKRTESGNNCLFQRVNRSLLDLRSYVAQSRETDKRIKSMHTSWYSTTGQS